MILSIDSLKNALVVLEKTLGLTQASKQSFLQAKSFTAVRAHVRDAMSKRKADDILAEILAPSDRDVLQAFLQGKLKAGSAQGGEIMGVLKQMKTATQSSGTAAATKPAKSQAYQGCTWPQAVCPRHLGTTQEMREPLSEQCVLPTKGFCWLETG